MELIRCADLVWHRDIAWLCRLSSAGREKRVSAVPLRPSASNFRRIGSFRNADYLDDVDAFGATLGCFGIYWGFCGRYAAAVFWNRLWQRRGALVCAWICQRATLRVFKAWFHRGDSMVDFCSR